jgi:predicted O-methyltransferase YrrM
VPLVSLLHEDAGRVLQRSADGAFDFVFLDSERAEYPAWWPQVRRVLRSGGLLVADNAVSHREQLAPFVALVGADPQFTTAVVPVGNGEFLAVKQPQ